MIDVGANVGVYSLYASEIVGPEGIVIAIEPFPEVFAQLYNNVVENGFKDIIRIRNLCLDIKTNATKLYMNHNRPNAFSINSLKHSESLSVLSVTLDDLVNWENLDRIDYIKIDVEGSELNVLRGGVNILSRFRPIIQLESMNNSINKEMDGYFIYKIEHSRNVVLIPKEKCSKIIRNIMDNNSFIYLGESNQ